MKFELAAPALLVCLVSLSSRADAQGNSFAGPIGGRSALMGNTGTALAVDGAAPFLNPATIVRMDDHRFAFAVNFYNFSLTHFSNWHQPGSVDSSQFGTLGNANTSVTSAGFNVLPSTLCLFFALVDGVDKGVPGTGDLHPGRHKLSLCLGSIESQGVSFTAIPFTGTSSFGQTVQAQSLLQSWNRFYAGPSYSVSLSSHLAVGVSLHAVYTTDSFVIATSAITSSMANGGVQSAFGAAGSGNSFDAAATIGGIYRVRQYTTGVSVALPALHAFGSYTGTLNNEYSSGATSSASISSGSGSFSAAPPVRTALGFGVELERLVLEADAALVIPAITGFTAALTGSTTTLSSSTFTSTDFASSFHVQEHLVVNPGIGAEYFIRPSLSLVGGASLNLSLQPSLAPTLTAGNLVEQRQSLATISGGVGSYGGGGNLMLGVQLGYGWGQALTANPYVTPNQWAIVDTSSYNVVFILAGSTSLRALGHAVERIEHVIVGNPSDPDATTRPGRATEPTKSPPANPP